MAERDVLAFSRPMIRALVLAGVALSVGCGLLFPTEEESTDGPDSGNVDEGGDGDAASSGFEAGDSDAQASREAGLPETGPVDAGPDANWCQTNAPGATFCDDFDIKPWDAGSSAESCSKGASGSLDPTLFRSPPYGLQLTSAPSAVSATTYCGLTEEYGSTSSGTLTMAFDVYFDNLDMSAPEPFAQFNLSNPSGEYFATLYATTSAIYLLEYLPNTESPDASPTPRTTNLVTLSEDHPGEQVWRRLEIDVSLGLDGGTGALDVKIDDPQSSAASVEKTIGAAYAQGTPAFVLGILYLQDPSESLTVHFDDVVINVE